MHIWHALSVLPLCVMLDAQAVASDQPASGFAWQTLVHSETAYRHVSAPVRAGLSSQRFEVSSGDCGPNPKDPSYSDCAMDRERVELVSQQAGSIGSEHWVAFSIYIPRDFTEVSPVRTVVAQIGQIGGPVLQAQGFISRPPLLQFNILYRSFVMTYHELVGHGNARVEISRDIPLAGLDSMRDRWIDVMLHVRFGDADGFAQVYVNGRHMGGINSGLVRWPVRQFPFKYGVYRSFISQYAKQYHRPLPTQVVYFDEIRFGKNRADVDLNTAPTRSPVD